MKLPGWLNMSKHDESDDEQLLIELEQAAARSADVTERLNRIITIEETRRRNLELRVEVMTRRGS